MEENHSDLERDLGNGGIYYRNQAHFPSSPRILLASTANNPKQSSVTWADDVNHTSDEMPGENGFITVHQNGCLRDKSKNGMLNYPGVLKSQHIEGKSACVVEIRRNSTQQSNKQTFTSSSAQNGDRHIGDHFVDLMKSRRLESLRRSADEKARRQNSCALLGQFDDRDKPYRSKVEFFGILLTFMLGLGNIVRFSFLCHQNGGGAFFIPYFIMLFLEGIPLTCLEMAIGQRYGKFSLYNAWIDLGPSLAGLGIAAIAENIIVIFYYNVMVSWCLYFCIQSLRDSLLWEPCATVTTMNGNQSIQSIESECLKSGPQKYFWYRKSLDISDDISIFSGFNMFMYIFIVSSWVSAWLLSMKELRNSSRGLLLVLVLIVTNLVIFFFFAVKLDGWAEGLAMLFTFDNLDRIKDIKVWMAAAGQIFYSMAIGYGSTILYSSGNKANNNFCSDALLVSLANSGTSLWASIIMFSFFGYHSHYMVEKCRDAFKSNSSQSIMSFMKSSNIEGNSTAIALANGTKNCSKQFFFEQIPEGMSLAFVGMTQAFGEMNQSRVYPALFFFLLFLLGVSSVPGMLHVLINTFIECVITPKAWRREIIAGIFCMVICLSNLLFVQSPGLYILELIDSSCAFPPLVIGFCECIGLSYVYGIDKFSKDVLLMTGKELSWKWKFCWKFVSPLIILGLIIGSIVNFIQNGERYYNVWDSDKGRLMSTPYPTWANVLFLFLTIIPLVCLAYPFLKVCFRKLKDSDILQGKGTSCGVCKDLFESCQDKLGQRSGTYDLTSPINFIGYDNDIFEMNGVQTNEGMGNEGDSHTNFSSANGKKARSRSNNSDSHGYGKRGLDRTSRNDLDKADNGFSVMNPSSSAIRASTSRYYDNEVTVESDLSDNDNQNI